MRCAALHCALTQAYEYFVAGANMGQVIGKLFSKSRHFTLLPHSTARVACSVVCAAVNPSCIVSRLRLSCQIVGRGSMLFAFCNHTSVSPLRSRVPLALCLWSFLSVCLLLLLLSLWSVFCVARVSFVLSTKAGAQNGLGYMYARGLHVQQNR